MTDLWTSSLLRFPAWLMSRSLNTLLYSLNGLTRLQNTFLGIANTPDIVNISQNRKTATLFEVSCAFDLFMEDSYCSKILKYQSLISTIENLGYKCQLIVLVFGSLGHVHRLVIRGLCIGGLSKTRAKQLAKYCSISARAVAITAISQYRAFESITAEECNNRSNRDISFFFFFFFKVMPFSFYT